MSNDLTGFYQENNFKQDGKMFYGTYKQRSIAITTKTSYTKVSISFNEQILKEAAQRIMNKVAELKRQHRSLQKGIVTGISIELYFYESVELQNNLVEVIDGVYSILDAEEVRANDYCPLCGKTLSEDAPFLKLKDGAVKAHDECIDRLLDASSKFEKGTFVDDKKTTLKGLLCNAITMLVIVGLIIVLSLSGIYIYVSIVAGWVFTLVIKTVLQKAKVPLSVKYMIMLTCFAVLTSVLSIAFGGVFDIYMNATEYFKEEKSLLEIFNMFPQFFTTHYTTIGYRLIMDVVLSLVFVGVNTFFDFKRASTTKNSIKKLQ